MSGALSMDSAQPRSFSVIDNVLINSPQHSALLHKNDDLNTFNSYLASSKFYL